MHRFICPTVTALNDAQYREQIDAVKPFAMRLHIDLMDGEFAPTISTDLSQTWWPEEMLADIHLMFERPMESLYQLIKLKPHMVIVHYEAQGDHEGLSRELSYNGIKTGLALLQNSLVDDQLLESLEAYDHVLIFSGKLGHHGGQADLSLLDKVKMIRKAYPDVEIGWDGGINDQNVQEILRAGVNVLNVGGFIQGAVDPWQAYAKIEALV
jgi:ribulose-phosphate 3-epimerase